LVRWTLFIKLAAFWLLIIHPTNPVSPYFRCDSAHLSYMESLPVKMYINEWFPV
jgi:hypothetical protein